MDAYDYAVVAPTWGGTDDEWDALVLAALIACTRHRLDDAGDEDDAAPCTCHTLLLDEQRHRRLLSVRRDPRFRREIEEHTRALARQSVK